METQQAGVAEAKAPAGSRAWHALDEGAVLGLLGSSRTGLTQEVAGGRLAEHGPNELRQAEPVRPVTLLIGQFKSLIVWILVAAAFVSGIMSEWADCIAILAIVVANGLIGFYQEYNAERSLAAIEFFKTRFPEHIMRTLRSLTFRAAPNARELSLIRAMALEVSNYLARAARRLSS